MKKNANMLLDTSMKKILFAVTTLFGGGAERVVSIWANKLSEKGYDVSILLYGRTENEYQVDKAVCVYSVASTYQDYKKMSYFARALKMRQIVKSISPDVVVNFLPRMQIWMMFACFGLNVKRVETVRVNPWIECRHSRFEKFLWNMCFARSNAIVLQTKDQSNYFRMRNRKKCVIIPNPIGNVYYHSYIENYSELCSSFIAVGRLTPQKNFPLLIKAFAYALQENNHISLKIFGVGDDIYKDGLQKQIDELHVADKIILMGRSNCMRKEYQSSDAFILSSNYEGMPNALLEAMASGLPCISTDCRTGPRDMIDDGVNGFLVNVDDVSLLARKIVEVSCMNKKDRENMGRHARCKILSICSEGKSLQKLISVIEA